MCDNQINDKIENNKKCPDTKKVISIFNSYIDDNTFYTLDEYKNFISLSYKKANEKHKKKSQVSKNTEKSNSEEGTECKNRIKKEPTKYNIFVKNEMLRLKETSNDLPYKELMKLAAKNWNEHKIISLDKQDD